MRLPTIAVMSGLLLIACSDDTNAPTPDQKTTNLDKGTTPDKPLTPREASVTEQGTTADRGTINCTTHPSPWTCYQIGQCAGTCGTDMNCTGAFQEKGCDSAKTKFGALLQCAIANCLASCTGGFNATCDACAKDKCATEYNACQTDVCP